MHRVIALVDMDCFYCQVEAKLNPELVGKPMAVVQYNAWKGGGIIAVNYEARDKGVTRHMRGNEAKQKCPDIELVRVATIRDKADLSKYRDASREVIAVLSGYSDCIERASIDEAYVDLTDVVLKRQESAPVVDFSQLSNTFIVGYSSNKLNDEEERSSGTREWLNDIYGNDFVDDSTKSLAIGAAIVEELRAEVYKQTGFRCSAGIAHNKILAKLVCGLHKPNRQTVLPHQSVPTLYETLSVKKVRSLGGKFGDSLVENLGCQFMGDLLKFSERELKNRFDDKTGSWLYNIARGIDYEPVTPRLISKSIGCCKRFPGKTCLKGRSDVDHWINKLSEELSERLIEDQTMNKRRAQLLTVSMTLNTHHQATSKSIPLPSYDANKIASVSFSVVRRVCSPEQDDNKWLPIYCLGISAGKFVNTGSSVSISHFLKSTSTNKMVDKPPILKDKPHILNDKPDILKDKPHILNDKPPILKDKPHIAEAMPVPSTSFFSKFINKPEPIEEVLSHSESISSYFNDSSGADNGTGINDSSSVKNSSDGAGNSEFCQKSKSGEGSMVSFLKAPRKSEEKHFSDAAGNSEFCQKNEAGKGSIDSFLKAPRKSDGEDCLDGAGNSEFCQKNEAGKGGIASFLKAPRKSDEVKQDSKDKPAKSKPKTIENFISSLSGKEVLDPLEIFPDLSVIDDEMLASFPLSFRKKVIELRKKREGHRKVDEPRIESGNGGDKSEAIPEDVPAENEKGLNVSQDIFDAETASGEIETCPECSEEVLKAAILEHLDHHMAERIHKELNSEGIAPAGPSVKSNTGSSLNSNTKRKSNNSKNENAKKFKTLKNFFSA